MPSLLPGRPGLRVFGWPSSSDWMASTHFQMKTLKRVGPEMALRVLAYNLKHVIDIMGIGPLIAAMSAA